MKYNNIKSFEEFISESENDMDEYSTDINEGILNVAQKILGFLTGKSHKLKSMSREYIKLRLNEAHALVSAYKELQDLIKRGKAQDSKEVKSKLTSIRRTKGRFREKLSNIELDMNEFAMKNDSYSKDIERIKQEADVAVEKIYNSASIDADIIDMV